MLKSKLRKKILKVRQKFNTKNIQISFNQIIKILKKEKISSKIIGGYYPVNFEADDLSLLRKFKKNRFNISLPVIKKNFSWWDAPRATRSRSVGSLPCRAGYVFDGEGFECDPTPPTGF